MAGRHLSAAIRPGDVVPSEGLVEVIESRNAAYVPGRRWIAECGWREYAVLSADVLHKARVVDKNIQPQTLALGVLGMPGLTAWAGFNKMTDASPVDTFVVSAASGAVGATVGQLAQARGCRVIGIAGGPEKCQWAIEQAGFTACIDYRAGDLRAALKNNCPNGINVYFDNVGGDTLTAVCEQLAIGSRIVLCGLAAQYNGAPAVGLNPGLLIKSRATLRGLVVYDHWHEMERMQAELGADILAGRLRFREDVSHGIESAPDSFCRLMRGENQGKSIVMI
jgi:NADPH-dependent curcumin reductase CurA